MSILFCKNYILTREQYEYGKQVYEAYVFALTFLPGILSIFYGDEVGLQGMGNLANRKPFPKTNQDEDLLKFFRQMGEIRKQEDFLRDADLDIKEINDKYIVYERTNEESSMLVATSRVGEDTEFHIPEKYAHPSKVYTLKHSKPGHLKPYGAVAIKR